MRDITSEDELRELLGGEPMRRAVDKERTALHEVDRAWLAASPFCLVATADEHGRCDVSPKGDPPGFTVVLDDTTIALPERAGNRRGDGFHNILANPHIGLIYLLPGRNDTLRINGRARLVTDAPFFDQMTVKGSRPLLATLVEIEQVFHHCPKAFMRSKLWDADAWTESGIPSYAHLSKLLAAPDTPIEELERYYGPQYANLLYPVR